MEFCTLFGQGIYTVLGLCTCGGIPMVSGVVYIGWVGGIHITSGVCTLSTPSIHIVLGLCTLYGQGYVH